MIMPRILLVLLSIAVLSCGTLRRNPVKTDVSLVDSIWTFSQTHPDGFTLDIRTWTEPSVGIAVSYEATQDNHGREGLELVISHAIAHEGYVGGWLNSADGLYYFDSVRVFPEDSLAAAVRFGRANHQYAIYVLSSGAEIRLDGGGDPVPSLVPALN